MIFLGNGFHDNQIRPIAEALTNIMAFPRGIFGAFLMNAFPYKTKVKAPAKPKLPLQF